MIITNLKNMKKTKLRTVIDYLNQRVGEEFTRKEFLSFIKSIKPYESPRAYELYKNGLGYSGFIKILDRGRYKVVEYIPDFINTGNFDDRDKVIKLKNAELFKLI